VRPLKVFLSSYFLRVLNVFKTFVLAPGFCVFFSDDFLLATRNCSCSRASEGRRLDFALFSLPFPEVFFFVQDCPARTLVDNLFPTVPTDLRCGRDRVAGFCLLPALFPTLKSTFSRLPILFLSLLLYARPFSLSPSSACLSRKFPPPSPSSTFQIASHCFLHVHLLFLEPEA